MYRLNISYKQFYMTLSEIWLYESDPNAPSACSEPGGKQWQHSMRGWRNCDPWGTPVLSANVSQISKFMGPTWGPPGSCRPQMGPILAPWTLLSGVSLTGASDVNTLFLRALVRVGGALVHGGGVRTTVRRMQSHFVVPYSHKFHVYGRQSFNSVVKAELPAEELRPSGHIRFRVTDHTIGAILEELSTAERIVVATNQAGRLCMMIIIIVMMKTTMMIHVLMIMIMPITTILMMIMITRFNYWYW